MPKRKINRKIEKHLQKHSMRLYILRECFTILSELFENYKEDINWHCYMLLLKDYLDTTEKSFYNFGTKQNYLE